MQEQWNHKIFTLEEKDFSSLALEIFRYQYLRNPVYKNYVDVLGINSLAIDDYRNIPFLPIRFFKTHQVKTGFFEAAAVFESSGTTETIPSRHFIKELSLYEQSFTEGFKKFYGSPGNYAILGLLPSYLERKNSSLVYMVRELIGHSNCPESGFFLNDHEKLYGHLKKLEERAQKTLLIGVSFALLDFAGQWGFPLKHAIVVETGGMKGRRKEMIRAELHDHLQEAFSLAAIHSEYGMTELVSQAWSAGEGIFHCPSWMRILIRDEDDPLTIKPFSSTNPVSGAINIIDLANIHSCSFIATEDAGSLYPDGSFEILGRLDNSDLRGCSLMVV